MWKEDFKKVKPPPPPLLSETIIFRIGLSKNYFMELFYETYFSQHIDLINMSI